ncbi:uncharacterized protein zbbx isoform X2 [Syngnathoides biaculeatus]|uniref:uncharacterized protein zbbx isoform X2 n=1 Tax=Syngnathoides biaculeatus TaxID=300417 RepID=UPI002ADD9347|nr:uncharacterized protein zbbx isoform X2 [Syngnathoides biaculeatus]
MTVHPAATLGIVFELTRQKRRGPPSSRGDMNLNDFEALRKSKSSRFGARNPHGLQMETMTLAQQGNELEEKLQKLKESMRREKGERGHSGLSYWKAEQFGSINSSVLTPDSKKTQKDSAIGKVKIRVLKDEPLTVPPHLPLCETCCCPQTTKQSRMRGPNCGQGDMFIGNYGEKTRVEKTKEEDNKDVKKAFANSLLGGEYDEEESAKSFQEALKEWRSGRCDATAEPVTIWTQTVPTSGVAAQVGFLPLRGHEGGREGWGGGKVPVKVAFPKSRLSYLDRLLLKKHCSIHYLSCLSSQGLEACLEPNPAFNGQEAGYTPNWSAANPRAHRDKQQSQSQSHRGAI